MQGNSGSGRHRSGMPAMSEINIIPLVDVVLVLLIIFMLTAHVMEFGLEVEVPKVKSSRDSSKELPVVSMTATGEVHLNDKIVNINSLGNQVRQAIVVVVFCGFVQFGHPSLLIANRH